MNLNFILYIFALYLFFTYQLTFLHNQFQNQTILYLLCALTFSFLFYFSYPYFHKEGFEMEVVSENGVTPLVNLISKIINPEEKANNYKIKNEFEMSNEIIDENMNEIVAQDLDTSYKADVDAKMELNNNLAGEQKNQWVISSNMQKKNLDSIKQKNMYCAADYNTVTACCDQPPAEVPSEYICGKEKPYCKGYVAFERWGSCEKESNVETFENYNTNGCKQTSELHRDGEDTIIGRFGKYVIWNMHPRKQTFAKEKIHITNAGYMFLPDTTVPISGATTFDEFNIQECILSIVSNYVNKKLPPYKRSDKTIILFPGNNSYSNTLSSANIVHYKDSAFEWNQNTELSMGDVFFILIDPNY